MEHGNYLHTKNGIGMGDVKGQHYYKLSHKVTMVWNGPFIHLTIWMSMVHYSNPNSPLFGAYLVKKFLMHLVSWAKTKNSLHQGCSKCFKTTLVSDILYRSKFIFDFESIGFFSI